MVIKTGTSFFAPVCGEFKGWSFDPRSRTVGCESNMHTSVTVMEVNHTLLTRPVAPCPSQMDEGGENGKKEEHNPSQEPAP